MEIRTKSENVYVYPKEKRIIRKEKKQRQNVSSIISKITDLNPTI